MRKRVDFFCLVLVFFTGCTLSTVDELMEVDLEFSDRSVEVGMKKAFLEYADESTVLLRPNVFPVVGKEAIEQFHSGFSDEGFTLSWKPVAGELSRSGDLGYTYGFYSMMFRNDSSILKGTYVSVWKKQGDRSWKYVLDTGNEGPQ